MIVTDDINTIRITRWQNPIQSWGLIPTMGYLHKGHLSLVQQAKKENEQVAVSIYVNPTQFSPTEDLNSYPRNLDGDLNLLDEEGVDLVFTPSNKIMYPSEFQTQVIVKDVAEPLEGASRPTHFSGVATVVSKLFNIIQPTRAYFGQKDAQQAVVINRLIKDLNFNVQLVICPIVREADGLAMSSRNAYLSSAERKAASILYRTLMIAKETFEKGENNAEVLRQLMQDLISEEPLAHVDYVSVADLYTLSELNVVHDQALVSMAVFIGKTRLIDNIIIKM